MPAQSSRPACPSGGALPALRPCSCLVTQPCWMGDQSVCMQPFESIMPIINNPAINTNKPLTLELLAKVCLLSPMVHCCIGPHNISLTVPPARTGVIHVYITPVSNAPPYQSELAWPIGCCNIAHGRYNLVACHSAAQCHVDVLCAAELTGCALAGQKSADGHLLCSRPCGLGRTGRRVHQQRGLGQVCT